MKSLINKDNLGTTKNWKFLRDDLLSIFAADDSKLLGNYNENEIEEVFDELAKEYLDGFTVSGFCIDAEDNVTDVLDMITVLAGASAWNCHPFGWDSESEYRDGKLYNVEASRKAGNGVVPTIFMIDISNAGDNYNKDFQRTLDEYMTLFGYGHMDCVYEQRLIYIKKIVYALKTKDTASVRDSLNSDVYVVKFEPYKFNLIMNDVKHVDIAVGVVLNIETWVSAMAGIKEEFDICATGDEEFDNRINEDILALSERYKSSKAMKFDIETTKTDNGYHYAVTCNLLSANGNGD
jgi:hypothetical protein